MADRATTKEEADAIVERWHRGVGPDELHDALGWTKQEYEDYTKTGQLPLALSDVVDTQTGETRGDWVDLTTSQAPDLMAALKTSLDAVRGPLETSKEDVEGDMIGDKTEPEISDVATNPFFAGVEPHLLEEVQAVLPQAEAMAETLVPRVDQPRAEMLRDVDERFHEAVTRRPSLMSADEAEALDVESFVLPDVAEGSLPNVVDLKYVDVGDQVTLEWDAREGTLARYTGLVIGLDRESSSRGMRSPWIYLRGKESHLRTPMEGIRIVSHLLNHGDQWVQTGDPSEYRPGR